MTSNANRGPSILSGLLSLYLRIALNPCLVRCRSFNGTGIIMSLVGVLTVVILTSGAARLIALLSKGRGSCPVTTRRCCRHSRTWRWAIVRLPSRMIRLAR